MALSPKLSKAQTTSVVYHSKFDYPLTRQDLNKWRAKFKLDIPLKKVRLKTVKSQEYFFVGDSKTVERRLQRQKYSQKKLELANKAAAFLKHIPTIKFVGVTGSLAMMNADSASDIDLMIISTNGNLWTTRGIVLLLLKLAGFNLRKAGDTNEKDKLCLNLWLDETDLKWKQRNEFTAHEIAQIVPLVNKGQTFEKFVASNSWIIDFWPNAIGVSKIKPQKQTKQRNMFNWLAFKFQYLYMKEKITNEVVSITRAQFHPSK